VDILADTAAATTEPAAKSAQFRISAETVGLAPAARLPLGGSIASFALEGSLTGKLPDSGNVTRWAKVWRDGGGSVDVSHMSLAWGPLGVTASATLALDDQLQPMGSGSAKLVGYAETLDRLASTGVLTRSAAIAATAVLSLMAGTSDSDEPSSVEVPLTLQYRTLSIRQVPLVRLPELDWPPE
jgi:hypothetical protein